MSLLLALAVLVSAPAQVSDAPVVYAVDGSHSTAAFAVRHLGLSRVRGRFDDVRGTLLLDTADITRSSITVIIGTTSVATGNDRRDTDLRDNFFDVGQFPTMTFQSTAVERHAGGLRVHGGLRIRDVTRPVVIEVEPLGDHAADATGERRVGFAGSFTIDRHTFGVRKEGHPAEVAGVIGDRVEITLELEGLTRDYERVGFNSRDKPSIGDLLLRVVRAEGADAAIRRYQQARQREPDGYNFAARELGILGLRLLQAGDAAAPAMLGLFVGADSTSALPHELLGRAWAQAGDRSLASASFRRALTLDPRATGAIEFLRRLEGTQGRLTIE